MPSAFRRSGKTARRFIGRQSSAHLKFEPLEARLVLDSTLVFNEVMYHPLVVDEAPLEWIELHSQMAVDMDISGWSIQGGVEFVFPEGTTVPGGGHIVVAASPARLAADGGFNGALGPFTGRLANGGEELLLLNNSDRLMDSVDYGDDVPWPVGPDGGGVSLAKSDPDLASEPAASWTHSRQIGGSPGGPNVPVEVPFGAELVLSVNPTSGAAAIQNHSSAPIQFNGYTIGSPSGSLSPGDAFWHSFDDAGLDGGNWSEANPTTHNISELNLFGSTGIPPAGSISIGSPYNTSVGAGDLTIEFALIDGARAGGQVVYGEPLPELPEITFNEIAAAGGAAFWLELENGDAEEIDLSGFVIATSDGDQYVFPAGQLTPGELLTVDHATLGFDVSAAARLFLYQTGRTAVVDAVVVKDVVQGRSPEYDGRWLLPDVATPGAANQFGLHDEIVINEIMYHPRPTQAGTDTLLPVEASWRFEDSGADQGSAWREVGFDDAGWSQGDALFFATSANLPAPKNTPLALGAVTYYFRTTFEFSGDPSAVTLQLRGVIDDGAVFYLNGEEIHRFNMAGGDVTHQTLATATVRDADFSDPILIPPEHLVTGANVLAVEVHQRTTSSNDVVFGAELFKVVSYAESTAAWIELYNRGDDAVDLFGWRFADGVRYDFAPGTSIAAGDFLVVAADPLQMQITYPGITVVGPYQGRLSKRNDRLVLLDDRGNPADEVEYFDGGRWPEFADGDGPSLELRDADADNSQPESWAASIESNDTEWVEYSYRGVAAPPPGSNDPTRWQEFVLGLLTAGEVLLDDISVIELPGGAANELIQNGGFDAGLNAWRIIGTHHGLVVPDPDDPANPVLHLTASGATEHMNNHAETTLAGGANIVNGRDYEISFRARWLAGSNQLNTRLYFNRLARTTLLEVPARGGTPGAPNSTFETNAGPTYGHFEHAPLVPDENDEVNVWAAASDPEGVDTMTLWWSADGGRSQSVAMTPESDGRYRATIPPQPAGSVVQFYIEGVDALGASSTFPAEGALSRALYQVDDGQTATEDVHSFRIIMTPADTNFLYESTNRMSNDRLGATVVYRDREVFYDVGVRLKGSGFGRSGGGAGFNIEFDPGRLFRGVHGSVAIDRGAGPIGGIGASQHELLFKHVINRAGGIPGMIDDVIDVIAPRSQFSGRAQLLMARYNDVFLDSQYTNGSDGTVYEFELIYFSTSTADSSPQGLKLPPGFNAMTPTGVDIRDMGDDENSYRWNYLITNRRQRDDYEPLIQMAQTFSADSGDLEQLAPLVMDVDQWMRTFAAISLGGVADTYSFNGLPHNLRIYIRPEDQRALAMPWDMDHAFFTSPTTSIFGTGNTNLSKFFDVPVFRRLFLGHINDIVNETFDPSYIEPWIAHYGDMAGQNFDQSLIDYFNTRRAFALNRLPAQVAFEVTTGAGEDFETDQPIVRLEGRGWIDVREIRLAGSESPLDVFWTGSDTWQIDVPLSIGANVLELKAVDHRGNLVGMDTITVTTTATARPLVEHLRITELMYNPPEATAAEVAAGFTDNEDFEFVELVNTSDTVSLDLGGAGFTNGLNFVFPPGTSLAPGERIVLARDLDALAARYDLAGVLLAGSYQDPVDGSNRLSNGGERLRLQDADGATILDFVFGDRSWHPATDGCGHSLVILDPSGSPDGWALRENWRPSALIGGSPGSADQTPLAGDTNGDGIVNIDDLNNVRNHFGESGDCVAGDTNGDQLVDIDDLNNVRNSFGTQINSAPISAESVDVLMGQPFATRPAGQRLPDADQTSVDPMALSASIAGTAERNTSGPVSVHKHRLSPRHAARLQQIHASRGHQLEDNEPPLPTPNTFVVGRRVI